MRRSRRRGGSWCVLPLLSPSTSSFLLPPSSPRLTARLRFLDLQKCQLCTEQHGTKSAFPSFSSSLPTKLIPFVADPPLSPPTVQCTKGKCTKAVHVTCALQVHSGIKMDATVPDPDHPGETTSILDAALDLEALDRAAANGEAVPKEEEKPAAAVEEKSAAKQIADADNDSIVLTVLCRTHNPVRPLSSSLSSPFPVR